MEGGFWGGTAFSFLRAASKNPIKPTLLKNRPHTQENMETFVVLRHSVTTLVTEFTYLTICIMIFSFSNVKVDCDPLLLRRALKQSD